MYEDYSFVLEWEEIDEDLREEKIEKFIRANMEEYMRNFKEANEMKKGLKVTIMDVVEDDDIRDDAENSIEAHFPIYF